MKILHTNYKASVLKCGHISEQISIERGRRQGDPIIIMMPHNSALRRNFIYSYKTKQ